MDEKTKQFNDSFNKSLNRFLIGAALVIIIIAAIFFTVFTLYDPKSGISAREFNAIENGMTYQDVVNIIGEEGELLTDMDLGIGSEYAMQMYIWYGSNGISNANISFKDGKVFMKAQFGLQ